MTKKLKTLNASGRHVPNVLVSFRLALSLSIKNENNPGENLLKLNKSFIHFNRYIYRINSEESISTFW